MPGEMMVLGAFQRGEEGGMEGEKWASMTIPLASPFKVYASRSGSEIVDPLPKARKIAPFLINLNCSFFMQNVTGWSLGSETHTTSAVGRME